MGNLVTPSLISMAGLAVFFAAILAFADKKLRVEKDPKVDEITRLLPGVNCGACGYLNCQDFAEHIIKEGVDPAECRVIEEEARKEIYEKIGKEEKEGKRCPKIPLVRCAAEWDNKKSKADYKGVRTCSAASLVFGGGMECEYGCMGFEDCAKACPFDALRMENGLPKLDLEKCTGCGKCAQACPRDIISLEEKKHEKLFYVACSSRDNMSRTKEACDVGCIACGICVKLSPEGFFKLEDNLSSADYDKQSNQEGVKAIAPKCPTKVIKEI